MSKKDKNKQVNSDGYEADGISDISTDSVSDVSSSSDPLQQAQGELDFADKIEELESKLVTAQAQLARAVADYHNLEKRVAESRGELAAWANGDLLRRIVPVLDHFDQALKGAADNGESGGWLKGVEMATRELRKTLEESGLETVQTDQFDPNLHEAVEAVEGVDGKILKVVEMGYTLNGKVLKPAKVVVGRSSVK